MKAGAGETFPYRVIVVGVVRRGTEGEPVLVRSLIAWTGRPPTAVLHVATKSDHGRFGQPGNGNQNGNGLEGARGFWKDLANRQAWVATAGFADLVLVGTGAPCPIQPAEAILRCTLASYDIRVNGNFQLLGPGGPGGDHLEIHPAADGVNGVVLGPAE